MDRQIFDLSDGPFATGKLFAGKYRVVRCIGEGGMGTVYLAEHVLMNRLIALKLLPQSLAQDRTSWQQFQDEARIASKVEHKNSVTLYDFGLDEDVPYLVMEYIDGRTLCDVVDDEGMLSLERIASIIEQVCAALSQAHALGIVHRDIKPSNIMLARKGGDEDMVKVLDFGIAQLVNVSGDPKEESVVADSIAGTPAYMSPEQCMGKVLDARSDIYSLGVLLYELLTSQHPFHVSLTLEFLIEHVKRIPRSIFSFQLKRAVPPAVEEVVNRCLAKDPSSRFQRIEEVGFALRSAIGEPEKRWGRKEAALALGFVSAASFLGLSLATPVSFKLSLPEETQHFISPSNIQTESISARVEERGSYLSVKMLQEIESLKHETAALRDRAMKAEQAKARIFQRNRESSKSTQPDSVVATDRPSSVLTQNLPLIPQLPSAAVETDTARLDAKKEPLVTPVKPDLGTKDAGSDSSSSFRKKRRRCGPSWCM